MRFDGAVPHGGYAWWYVDALSGDRRHALTIIAFIGSVFSPWYAAARRRGRGDPENHVSINAILYRPEGKKWAMTERGRGDLHRSARHIAIGPSSLRWCAGKLIIEIDEWTVPLPGRLRGTVVIDPGPIFGEVHALDSAGRHRWRPVAPLARAEAHFTAPDLAFSSHAYLDMNAGDEALENGFSSWVWSRSALPGGGTAIFYDAVARTTTGASIANSYAPDGTVTPLARPPLRELPGLLWRVERSARSAQPIDAAGLKNLEDTPFYTRSSFSATIEGQACPTISESVDLDRFAARWVQGLLPFKMPRWSK
ncbi:carotenoid 1,2-hydratase [Chelativorans sp. ZYF759]|nr:carotenoid 1,2-hydratase [Chelativorans sp. ZYF759]